MLKLKLEGWTMMFLAVLLTACSNKNLDELESISQVPPTQVQHLSPDGDIYKIETTVDSDAWADARLAEENTKCWKEVTKNSEIKFPEGADAMTMMAIGLIEGNRALAKAVSEKGSESQPCQLATNSNDVEIAQEEGKTKRTEVRWNGAPKIVTTLAATAFGINSQNKNAEIAVAGVNAVSNVAGAAIARSGNSTVINGDNNQTSTTSQNAGNDSTVVGADNDSSELDQNSTDSVVDAASCVAAGHDVRPATQEEINSGTALLFVNNGVVV